MWGIFNKFRKKNKVRTSGVIFLNKPVSEEEDIIGVAGYVDRIQEAIVSGAQMLAIVSDFAGGKSSVIEMLKNRMHNKKYRIQNDFGKRKVKIMTLNLWSELEKSVDDISTIELHKKMMFQMMNGMNRKRGSYIQKRLNGNYGVLRINSSSTLYTVLGIVFLALMGVIAAYKYFDLATVFGWQNGNVSKYVYGIGLSVGIIIAIVLIVKSDVIFSLKTKRENPIEENEIIDLFYRYVINSNIFVRNIREYVFVIEDLDRCNNAVLVHHFLTELRKYYVPYDNECAMVTFIVNIKPEFEMQKLVWAHQEKKREVVEAEIYKDFYTKIFEQIIHISKINIENYDNILRKLLEGHKEQIKRLLGRKKQLNWSVDNLLEEYQGLNWLIQGKSLSIRLVKERLNICFAIYESLTKKFPEETRIYKNQAIDMNKCAIMAYLQTEYPKIILSLNDGDFQKIVEGFIIGEIESEQDIEDKLKISDASFAKDLYIFLKKKYVDNTYRIYFYNYPKGSLLLTSTESTLYNAILYDERITDTLNRLISLDEENVPQVLNMAFKKSIDLGVGVRENVTENEFVYKYALRFFTKETIEMLQNMSYEANHFSMFSLPKIENIIKYGVSEDLLESEIITEYCRVWSEKCSSSQILLIREMICEGYPNLVLKYWKLYFGGHPLISMVERKAIDNLTTVLSLLDYDSSEYNVECFLSLHREIIKSSNASDYEKFYTNSIKKLENKEIWLFCMEYVCYINKMLPEIDEVVCRYLVEEDVETKEQYVTWLFHLPLEIFTERVMKNIESINFYDGITLEICNRFYEYNMFNSYVQVMTEYFPEKIDFSDVNVKSSFSDNSLIIFGDKKNVWLNVRKIICKMYYEELQQYSFMFTDNYPFLTSEEVGMIDNVKMICCLLAERTEFDDEDIECLIQFFSEKERTKVQIMCIYRFISQLLPKQADKMFYSLDQDNIRYSKLSKGDKSKTKQLLKEHLALHTVTGMMKFVSYTRIPDDVFTCLIVAAYSKGTITDEKYVEYVNCLHKISDSDYKCILTISKDFAYSGVINNALYENAQYIRYVISEILGKDRFEIQEEKRDILWNAYLEIFVGNYSRQLKDKMSQNLLFLSELYESKFYCEIEDISTRMYFSVFMQTRDSLEDVVKRFQIKYVIEYFTKVNGFADANAANYFLEQVEANKEIAKNIKVYENAYDKLVSSVFRSRLTKARNKATKSVLPTRR